MRGTDGQVGTFGGIPIIESRYVPEGTALVIGADGNPVVIRGIGAPPRHHRRMLLIVLVLLALALAGVGVAVEALRWLLIIAIAVFIAGLLAGRRR